MKNVKPVVVKIAETKVDPAAMETVLRTLGVSEASIERFLTVRGTDGQMLTEFAGRMCYESYEPGLNPNVTKIREEPGEYFANILMKGDGSVIEHGVVSFAFLNVSRVCTHEIVRHRVGTAISQESLRYVRPRDVKFWIPDELAPDQAKAMTDAVEDI